MDYDLSAMNLDELKGLRGAVDRAIADYQTRKRRDAQNALEEKARELGFSLSDFTGRRGKRAAPAAASTAASGGKARYAHPDNDQMTWSGRGRRPGWVNDHVNSGKSLDDLAI